jgi:hypothetical protein
MWHAWERGETCTRFWWESPKEKDQGVDGRMGSKWTLERLVRGWSGFTWLRIGIVRGCYECGDKPSGSGAMGLVSYINVIFFVKAGLSHINSFNIVINVTKSQHPTKTVSNVRVTQFQHRILCAAKSTKQ